VLKVPRRGPYGGEDPGVLTVVLLLPPKLASNARHHLAIPQWVTVAGLLDTDTDHSQGAPQAHHTVVAESIEPCPPPSAAQPRPLHLA
jgi:hypothetical protein